MNDMAVSYTQHRITVDEYHQMDAAGVFPRDARIELVDGILIDTIEKINPPHADAVDFLDDKLKAAIGERARVRCQLPITLGDASEPEPDFAIVRGPRSSFKARHPGPDDITGLIEVADSSRPFDLGRKVPIYASFGIPEVWIVDLIDSLVHVFRVPAGQAYENVTIAAIGDEVSLLAFPDVRIRVADIFA